MWRGVVHQDPHQRAFSCLAAVLIKSIRQLKIISKNYVTGTIDDLGLVDSSGRPLACKMGYKLYRAMFDHLYNNRS